MPKKQIEKIDVESLGKEEKYPGHYSPRQANYELMDKLNEVIQSINSQEEEMHKRMDELKDIDFTKVTNNHCNGQPCVCGDELMNAGESMAYVDKMSEGVFEEYHDVAEQTSREYRQDAGKED